MPAEEAGDPDPSGLKKVATDVEQVRAGVTWLITALVGVGTILVPSLGLTNLGTLDPGGWRFALALVALLVALGAALWTVLALLRFARSAHVSLADLAARERKDPKDPLVDYLNRNRTIFRARAKSVGELERRYEEAHDELAEAQQRAAEAAPAKYELVAEAAAARLAELEAVEAQVMDAARLAGTPGLTLADLANAQRARMRAAPDVELPPGTHDALDYLAKHPALFGEKVESLHDLRERLLEARAAVLELEATAPDRTQLQAAAAAVELAEARLDELKLVIQHVEPVAALEELRQAFRRKRLRVALLPLLIALAMAAFVVAANEPPVDRNDLRGETIRDADLSGTKLDGADLRDTTFVDSNLTGADLGDARTEGSRFVSSICPDGHRTAASGAGATCAGHLKLKRPPVIRPATGATHLEGARGGS